jgi:hypothetical protein
LILPSFNKKRTARKQPKFREEKTTMKFAVTIT